MSDTEQPSLKKQKETKAQTKSSDEPAKKDTMASRVKKQPASTIKDTQAYNKTVGGRLKLKSNDFKNTAQKTQDEKSASALLKDRIAKKSDRYAMNTLHDDDV